MDNLKENQLIFTDDKGDEVLCDIIFTYHSEEYNKDYVFFTPVGASDDDDNIQVSCASYIPQEDGIGELNEVTSDEEWEMLSEVFNAYVNEDDEEEMGCACGNCESCEGECDPESGSCGGCPGCHK